MSFSNLSINQDINNLSKYVVGATINEQGESSYILPGVALMGGVTSAGWLFKNRKNLKGGVHQLAENGRTQKKIVSSTSNLWKGATEYTSKAKLESLAANLAKKDGYEAVKSAISKSLKSGKNYTEALKNVEKLKAVENLNQYTAKVASQMKNGSKLRTLKNYTGITKLSKTTKELAAKSGKFRGLLKGIKGNAGFALISLGVGVLTDVIPAFQLGKDKGFKQLGKTAVKTGAEVAGWAAGSAVGAKIGAAVGSFCGPIGTVVGGAIGLVGGFVGSFLASKLADKVVGKSEVELAQEEAAKQVAQSANESTENVNELLEASYEQLVEKAKTGNLTKDDIAAKDSLENILGTKIDLDAAVAQANQASTQETTAQTPETTQTVASEPQGTTTEVADATKPEEKTEENSSTDTTTNPTFSSGYNFSNPYLSSGMSHWGLMQPYNYFSNPYSEYSSGLYNNMYTQMSGLNNMNLLSLYPTAGNKFQYVG